MIELASYKARSLDVDHVELTWSIKDTSEDPLDYYFEISSCESPEGPFESMATFQDRYHFVDTSLNVGHRWRMKFYRISIIENKPALEPKDHWISPPFSVEPDADLATMEIRRHILLQMAEFAGRKAWLLPVKTFGPRCPSCWDSARQRRTRSGCLTCYGTGFIRGFMDPIEIHIQVDPSPKSTQPASTGPQQTVNTTARMGYYPPVKPEDLIIEPENRRWRVEKVHPVEHLRAVVRQELGLHEVNPEAIEFQIDLKLDRALSELQCSPPRNFTNPHNLENVLQGPQQDIVLAHRLRRI